MVCVDNSSVEEHLTVGMEYEIIATHKNLPVLRDTVTLATDDLGTQRAFFIYRFAPVSALRPAKVAKLTSRSDKSHIFTVTKA